MRDMDAMVNLFPEDVRVGKDKVGRAYFKQWMDETLRVQFTGTAHHIGNHIIEFETPTPLWMVYSKNEHETPVLMADRVGDHADAVGSLSAHRRSLVFQTAFTPLLVRHRPQQTASR